MNIIKKITIAILMTLVLSSSSYAGGGLYFDDYAPVFQEAFEPY